MATNTSVLNSSTLSTEVTVSPQEAALQSLCKQILKSRLFRGFYEERRYVEELQGYRDIVSLHKSEKDLNKLIKDIRNKLQLFFQPQNPNKWIGITCGALVGSLPSAAAMDTFIWAEMDDLAFGQYWFSIKTLKFRENEVIVRLKVVRSVEAEEMSESRPKIPQNTPRKKAKEAEASFSTQQDSSTYPEPDTTDTSLLEKQVNLNDFVELLHSWWSSIKLTTYDFMSNDINRDNIKGFMRFLGLVFVSIITGAFVGLKFLGIFTIRLLFELSRLTHVLTPTILMILDVFNKIIGGFYILLAMMWKDTVGSRAQRKQAALEYNRPMYQSIQYNVSRRSEINLTPREATAEIYAEN